jgi:hypothetical protein
VPKVEGLLADVKAAGPGFVDPKPQLITELRRANSALEAYIARSIAP